MGQGDELGEMVRGKLGWNKAGIGCFCQAIMAVVECCDVRLGKMANNVMTAAKLTSNYRRLQRLLIRVRVKLSLRLGELRQVAIGINTEINSRFFRTKRVSGKGS